MTTVDLTFRFAEPPSEITAQALARISDVYGIRALQIDSAARALRIEYDASRLSAAAVSNLVRRTGLAIVAPSTMQEPVSQQPATA